MGLYVPKNRRVYAWPFARSDSLTPLYRLIAPRADSLPAAVRDAVLDRFDDIEAPAWASSSTPGYVKSSRGFTDLIWGPGVVRRSGRQWLKNTVDVLVKSERFPAAVREHMVQEFGRRDLDWLIAQTKRLDRRKLGTAFDVDETADFAERLARLCRREGSIENIKRLAEFVGLELPKGTKQSTPESIARRCYEPKTWRRIIERTNTRDAENCLREMGYVERRANLYCSRYALDWHKGKMRAQESWLKSHVVTAPDGEQLSLFYVHEHSVANPTVRRAELMTRMKGFEDIANELGHVAEFVTLTCPSKFHSMLSDGGENLAFGGHSPREAQAWLNKMWARARAAFKRKGLLVYGFRVAEPHHDGTPHWHMVLFTLADHLGAVRAVLKARWLSEHGAEPGAASHRIKFKSIDPAQGSACGYISKYIAKNIDGHNVGEDFETLGQDSGTGNNRDAASTAHRVRAWASLHGIRQFQQIGGPGVTLYREARRIRAPIAMAVIERARSAADAGDFANYIRSLGGIAARNGPLALWRKRTGQTNQYGEPRGPQLKGIRCGLFKVPTHVRAWTIERLATVQLLTRVQGKERREIHDRFKRWRAKIRQTAVPEDVFYCTPGAAQVPEADG